MPGGFVVDDAQIRAVGRVVAVDAVDAAAKGDLPPVAQKQHDGRHAAFIAEGHLRAVEGKAPRRQLPRDGHRRPTDGAARRLEAGQAALAVAHGAGEHLVHERLHSLVRQARYGLVGQVGVGRLAPGQPREAIERRVVEGARFDGVDLPFPEHLRTQAIGDEMLERAIRELLQTAHGEGFVPEEGTGRGGRDGLCLPVKAQRAQQPHGGGCGVGRGEELLHALAPAGRERGRAVGMGAQQHPQRTQRLRRGQGQVLLRDGRARKPRHQTVAQLPQKRQRPQGRAVWRGLGTA